MTKILPSIQDLRFSQSNRIYSAENAEPRNLFAGVAFLYKIINKFSQLLFNAKSITQSNVDNSLNSAITNLDLIRSLPENINNLKEAKNTLIDLNNQYNTPTNAEKMSKLSTMIDEKILQIVTEQCASILNMYSNASIKTLRLGINQDTARSPNRIFEQKPIIHLLPKEVSYDEKNLIGIAKDTSYITKAIMCNAFQNYSIFGLGYKAAFDMSMNGTVNVSQLNTQTEYQLIAENDKHVILKNIVTVKKDNATLLSVSGEITFSKQTIDAIFNESISESLSVKSPVISIKSGEAFFGDALYQTVSD